MKKKKILRIVICVLVLFTAGGLFRIGSYGESERKPVDAGMGEFLYTALESFSGEPEEVKNLRNQEIVLSDEGHQEYYFSQLGEAEQRAYREMLNGIQARQEEFYLTISGDEEVDRVYHAVLKDHPELYWVHNRRQVYKTTYEGSDYCLFSPGYSYTEEEMQQIDQSMELAWQDVNALIPESGDDYEIVKTVYTYLIDSTEYVLSEDDQSIAGVFWKKSAVCAGYAGAMQYLLERFGIPCIYVDGSAEGSSEGHAWNIVQLGGNYYYVDVTNGDQPQFLEGDAVQMAEHKTTIYDYLCPFPAEYELNYTASEEFAVPECTATDKNFYVLNQGCFETYNWQAIYDYCVMRINYGAAVVRFKFSNQEAFDAAYSDWIEGGSAQEAARYYMDLYGMTEVEYHYGVLDDMKTFYFMF